MRDIEFAWAAFLTRGMEQGVIPQTDARLLTHAVLGLYKSVWHWYRPGGGLSLDDIRDFFVERCLAVAGYSEAAVGAREACAQAAPYPRGGLIALGNTDQRLTCGVPRQHPHQRLRSPVETVDDRLAVAQPTVSQPAAELSRGVG